MSETTFLPGSASQGDPIHWRSLDQLENTPEFQEMLRREFPEGITDSPEEADEVSRRGFLSAVAASVALAGLASCRKPKTRILPFNRRPEGFKPGMPRFYATTLTRSGLGLGVLVKSSDGRPTKIEGNPLHPSSRGGSDQFLQAELLTLYDPGRSQHARGPGATPPVEAGHDGHGPTADGQEVITAYQALYGFWEDIKQRLVPNKGAGLRILMPPTSSPTLLNMVEQVRAAFPDSKSHTWEPLHRDREVAGSLMAFGKALQTHVDYAKADVVVSLDCDFLGVDGDNLRNARTWSSRRRAPVPGQAMPRLYSVEASYSVTGTMADHRFRTRAVDIPGVAMALAAVMDVGPADLATAMQAHENHSFRRNGKDWIAAIARDLNAHRGRSVVVAGPRAAAAVHAVAHAINAHLGNVGATVTYTDMPASLAQSNLDSIRELARDIGAGSVQVLVCLGTNPVYDAPADLQFGKLLADNKVPNTIHVGLHEDETAKLCQWHFPVAHELEAWGDARAADGTLSLRQPLVEPLFGGISQAEFLALLSGHPVVDQQGLWFERNGAAGHELVRSQWQTNSGAVEFEGWWNKALHDGVVEGSAFAPTAAPAINAAAIATAVRALPATIAGSANNLEIVFRADSKLLDGRYANNSWMQELPDPLTKLTWDNAAVMSVRTAAELGVQNGDLINIGAEGGQTVRAPVWILPGHADYSVTLTLGYGRNLDASCKVAKGAGFNAYSLRTVERQHVFPGLRASKAGGKYPLATTQDHGTMAGRAIVRETDTAGYQKDPEWAPKMSLLDKQARLKSKAETDLARSLWKERGYDQNSADPAVAASPYQWGMVIDLNACTGCSACVAACSAENNVPMVGKQQVARGREMSWIRTDRYFASIDEAGMEAAEDPQVSHMPVPCMQCENAPCEAVCPVMATSHSPDGLNDMVYNRCIGTRYCSNNCPYKVRRFNYFDYLGKVPETRKMAYNPDVTVRSRGVMEKCTYCVQRINGARIQSKLEKRLVRDGEIAPACAQACPTEAITFGNILDKDSKVSKLKASTLNYGLLSDLNTKPRTTYLGRIRNPNPELA